MKTSGYIGIGLALETRSCGECKNFKLDHGANVMGTCCKKLMSVISTLQITYKPEQGSCFEFEVNYNIHETPELL